MSDDELGGVNPQTQAIAAWMFFGEVACVAALAGVLVRLYRPAVIAPTGATARLQRSP